MEMHFPNMIQAEGITPYGQILKIREELREFFAAAPDSRGKAIEAWDVIAAFENWLRSQEREGRDIERAKTAAFAKNRERGYYRAGEPGRPDLPCERCAQLYSEASGLRQAFDEYRAEHRMEDMQVADLCFDLAGLRSEISQLKGLPPGRSARLSGLREEAALLSAAYVELAGPARNGTHLALLNRVKEELCELKGRIVEMEREDLEMRVGEVPQ